MITNKSSGGYALFRVHRKSSSPTGWLGMKLLLFQEFRVIALFAPSSLLNYYFSAVNDMNALRDLVYALALEVVDG